MKISNTNTPVVILQCGLGALGIMRTLGVLGIDVYGVTNDPKLISLRSRYCRGHYLHSLDTDQFGRLTTFLVELSQQLGEKPILIATSDETAIFVAEYFEELSPFFHIGQNAGGLVSRLADKMTMFEVANECGIQAPTTLLPSSLAEAQRCARQIGYPVMIKGAMGNRLFERSGKKMVFAHSEQELIQHYMDMEDPDDPNLMIQEVIPGDDSDVFIFNGYFDSESRCLAAFTGRKIRQFPIHTGCASLGECCWMPELAEMTINFMQNIGYRGILDIGYRRDPRDGAFKVLDINPRVGQAFRLFTSLDDLDVVRALYLDLTGQTVPKCESRHGRRWMIEDFDVISSYHYYREGSLTLRQWATSFRRLEECAWFSWRDPVPFLLSMQTLGMKLAKWAWKQVVRPNAGEAQRVVEVPT